MLGPMDHVGSGECTPVGHVVSALVARLVISGEEPQGVAAEILYPDYYKAQ